MSWVTLSFTPTPCIALLAAFPEGVSMNVVCAICLSLFTQQVDVPAAPKPGLLSRLWEKYGYHRRFPWHCITKPDPDDPEEARQGRLLGQPEHNTDDLEEAKTTLASLTEQLESLRKQEAKVIDALKKQYEADKVRLEEEGQRLEEERKRLEELGVLKEHATSVVLDQMEQYAADCEFKIKGDVDFVWEVRVEPGYTWPQEDYLILVARKRADEVGQGLEEERKLGVLPATFDGYRGVWPIF
jgi:hypothetical protein